MKPEYNRPGSFKKYIPLSFFKYVFTEQSILDAEFLKVANRQPALRDRKNSLLDEKGEFYNETKRESRYWANKVNNEQRLLEEYSDILHFYMGIAIVEIEKEVEDLRLSALLFRKTTEEIRESLIIEKYKTLDQSYLEAVDLLIFKAIYEEDRGIEMGDVIEVLSEGRRANEPTEILALATLTMALYGFSFYEIQNEYNRVRENNYKRIERTRNGQADR